MKRGELLKGNFVRPCAAVDAIGDLEPVCGRVVRRVLGNAAPGRPGGHRDDEEHREDQNASGSHRTNVTTEPQPASKEMTPVRRLHERFMSEAKRHTYSVC